MWHIRSKSAFGNTRFGAMPFQLYKQMVRQLALSERNEMMKQMEVGILGATGMVGQHFIRFLEDIRGSS